MSNWGGERTGAGHKPATFKNELIQRLDQYIDNVEVKILKYWNMMHNY